MPPRYRETARITWRGVTAAVAAPGLALLLGACATPAERFIDDAAGRGFEVAHSDAPPHRVTVVRKGAARAGGRLHVYLDGDGSPWLSRRRIAADPTSRDRLVLALMQRDPRPAVLVGRPCYYETSEAAAACDARLWTSHRYGEPVVAAMAATVRAEAVRSGASAVTLIGYSGGGALAMLIAPRVPAVDRVVTVAANLDVDAWAAHHGFTPLGGSLNPAALPPLPAHIAQLHLFGADDANVPAALMRPVADRQPNTRVRVVPDYDHGCCWMQDWPALLATVENEPQTAPTVGDAAARGVPR